MQKTKKKLVYVVLAALLVVLQLSTVLTALADEKTALKVKDIGDEALYAVLASATDPYGNNGGVLYKEDAEALTYVDFNNSGIFDNAKKVKSFANFAKYCPNITQIYESGSIISSEARRSYVEEIAKLDNITRLSIPIRNMDEISAEEQLSILAGKNNTDKLTYLSLELSDYSSQEDIDMSFLGKFANISTLRMYNNSSYISLKGLETALSGLSKLSDLSIRGNVSNYAQDIVSAVNKNVKSLELSNSAGNAYDFKVDFSSLSELTSLELTNIYNVSGINTLSKLDSLTLLNNRDYTATISMNDIPDSLKYLSVSKYNFTEGTVLDKFPSNLETLSIKNSDITAVNNLDKCSRLSMVNIGYCNLTEIPALPSGVHSINMPHNAISAISNIENLNNLNYLDLSYNKLESTNGLPTTINFLSELNLSGNKITTLTDLKDTKLSNNQRTYGSVQFYDSGFYGFSLSGNCLTEEDIKGKVPEACENDKYWMYAATTGSTANGHIYFKSLNNEIISKVLESDSTSLIYTTQQNIDFDEELVSYIKEKNKTLTIKYINNDVVSDQVTIRSDSLDNDTKSFKVTFTNNKVNPYMDQIKAVFGKYGEVESSIALKKSVDSGINGVKYSEYVKPDFASSEDYNCYQFNKEDNTFRLTSYSKWTSLNKPSDDEEVILFYVPASKDNLLEVIKVITNSTQSSVSYRLYHCFKQYNDDVVNGLLSITKGAQYHYTPYFTGNSISLSKDTIDKLKTSKKNLNITSFDKENIQEGIRVYINYSSAASEALDFSLPEVTVSEDTSTLSASFSGGTPSYVYKIGNIDKIKGVTFSQTFKSKGKGLNLYTVRDGNCIPVAQSSGGYSQSLNADKDSNSEFFTVDPAADTFVKTVTVTDGDYAGNRFSYIANPDSNTIKAICNYNDSISRRTTINVCTDKVVLDADTINTIKNGKSYFEIEFYDSNIGMKTGVVSTYPSNLRDVEPKDITIEKPDVEITTSNADFEKVLDPALAVRYVTAKSAIENGFRYSYSDPTVLNAKFENRVTYTRLGLNNGKIVSYGSSIPSSSVTLLKGTYAYVKSADYATPGDTPSTPSDTPDKDNDNNNNNDNKNNDQNNNDNKNDGKNDNEDNGDTTGKNVSAAVISEDKLTNVDEVNSKLTDSLVNSSLAEVSIVSAKKAPTLSSNIFSQMKKNQNDITIGVTDENNRLQYQWSFSSDTITQSGIDMDLTISFDTDRENEVKEITGRDDLMYLSFSHHGALPGPAKIKTYVGNKYKDGDVVYLYYFNEDKNRVESVGGVNQGLVVKDGYVEYTITHCSLYFLSQETAQAIKAVDPDTVNDSPFNEVSEIADNGNSADTADTTRMFLYIMETLMAAAVVAGLVVTDMKKKSNR